METYEEYGKRLQSLHEHIGKFCDKHNFNREYIDDIYRVVIQAVYLGKDLNGSDVIYDMGWTMSKKASAWSMLYMDMDNKFVYEVTRLPMDQIDEIKKSVVRCKVLGRLQYYDENEINSLRDVLFTDLKKLDNKEQIDGN